MKMHIKTLGVLSLENIPCLGRLPLLLLSYLALEGKINRQRLANLFWMHQSEPKRRLQNLSETLYEIKKIHPDLVVVIDDEVSTTVTTDAANFEKSQNVKEALDLYEGPFLANIERYKRLTLCEELTEWILNKRESLQTHALNLQLEYAEKLAFESQFDTAATLAWQAFTASTAIAYPNHEVYRRTHTLLLAAEQTERAGALQKEAADIYGEERFPLDQPFKARAYLTHTFNLRPAEDDLIDRDKDIQELLRLLEGSRLITICGPAGVGKTVLAQALARVARGQPFTNGGVHIAYFESLPQDASFDSLMRQVSEALGIAPSGKTLTLNDLSNFIADEPRLLVLDNLEHVSKEATRIIQYLYDTCAGLRIVTTSRQQLKLKQESLFSLKPLTFPADSEAVSLETIHTYGAVTLFERDAKKYGFQLTENSLSDITKVCQMVEGLPLALKLAAAWTSTLTSEQIVQELTKNIDVLGAGTHDTPRHSSIRATFDHSLSLLSAPEVNSLISLGAFENGFNLEAAQAITQAGIFILRGLVEKSLIRFDHQTNRYDFHPLLFRYIQGLFQKREDKDMLGEAHARYYLALLDTVIDEEGNERGEVLPLLKLEMENIDKAWRYATDHSWFEELFRSSKALQNFASLTAQYRFGDVLIKYCLDKIPEDTVNLRAAFMANLSALKYWRGSYKESIKLAHSAYELLTQATIEPGRMLSITRLIFGVLSSGYSCIGNFAESLKISRKLVHLLRRKAPNTPAYCNALGNLAIHERDILGNYDPTPFYEALSIAETQVKVDVPWLLINLSESLLMANNFEKAEQTVLIAEELSEQMQLGHWLVMSQYRLAIIKLQQNEIWEAIQITLPLLEKVKKHNKPSLSAVIYQLAGNIEMARGSSQRAWDYYVKALNEANGISSITLINSIKISILEWSLSQKDRFALQLLRELRQETKRMYFHDQVRFSQVIRASHIND
jgi:DNA-binding SARP family transcriptional activator/tetratricopeptide (TPR) repeat protein